MFNKFQERPIADQVVLALAGVAAFCIMGIMVVVVWDVISRNDLAGLEKAFSWLSRIINTIVGFVFGYITAGAVSKSSDKSDGA